MEKEKVWNNEREVAKEKEWVHVSAREGGSKKEAEEKEKKKDIFVYCYFAYYKAQVPPKREGYWIRLF